ncbi:MAG TPA: hypothetical protein VFU40_03690 [Gemmatimonadales bacterium]|nr:hypothetical protein [Gemmatimonadales bacterium]
MTPANTAWGVGCLVLFLLPFAGAGVVTAVLALQRAAAGNWQEALFLGLFALTFGGVGIGGIVAGLAGSRKLKEQAALEARYPGQPWLWRRDWASGRIIDVGRSKAVSALMFTLLWNLVGLPAGYFGVRAALTEGNHAALVGLLFPVVGAGLLVWAARATIRYRKYGISHLQLSTIPGIIGRSLAGAVSVPGSVLPPDGFRATLSCIRRVTTGSGDSRSTAEHILWQDERKVQGTVARIPAGTVTNIPVAFRLPADATVTDGSNPRNAVIWRLQLSAAVPGVDYDAAFEVPVFRTAATDLPPTPEEERLAREGPPAVYEQPPASRIVVTTNRRGTEVVFPAARNPGAATGLTLFLALWLGAIGFQLYLGVPAALPIVSGIFGALILIGVLDLWLGVSQVNVDAGELSVATGYLYPGRARTVAALEIADVAAVMGMRSGRVPYYDVTVIRKNGRKIRAGRSVRDKREAEWLAAVIRKALGLT